MSINRDMKSWTLQINEEIRTGSGAVKENWKKIDTIEVAVYQKDESHVTSSERYRKCTHTGLTYYKEFDKEKSYRLVSGDNCFAIDYFNTESRLTNLFLKEVDSYGSG